MISPRAAVRRCLCTVALLLPLVARGAPDSVTVRPVPVDSAALFPLIAADSLGRAPAAPTKSPSTALLLSAVIPGAGQAYNESWWKVPVVAGLGIYFTSQWLHYNRLTTEARESYEASLAADPPDGDPRQLQLREFYKDERDTYTWYLFILYVLNLADAYVDASLYDFTVSDDLSLRLLPEGPARIGLRITF